MACTLPVTVTNDLLMSGRRAIALHFAALAQNNAFGGDAAFNFSINSDGSVRTERALKIGFSADNGLEMNDPTLLGPELDLLNMRGYSS